MSAQVRTPPTPRPAVPRGSGQHTHGDWIHEDATCRLCAPRGPFEVVMSWGPDDDGVVAVADVPSLDEAERRAAVLADAWEGTDEETPVFWVLPVRYLSPV